MKSLTFIIITFLTPTLFAQENALVVLEKYYSAIGGQNNISKIDNIYSFADCSGPNGKYQTEVFSAKGFKTFFRQIRENRPDYIGIVNGKIYWTKGADVAISDKNTASMWRSHELQWLATHLTERFREYKFEGIEEFAGKQAIKLSVVDELSKTAYLYFDSNSYLFQGFTISNPVSKNPELIQMVINTWEKVDKLMLPTNVTFRDKNGEYILNFHTIKINQTDPRVFDIPDKIIAIQKLLEIHELQRTAHFNRDAKLLVSIMVENFTEISNGKINSPKKEDLIKRFENYFDAVTFIEWDDINPPIIKISDDVSMAHMYVSKRVKLRTKDQTEELTTFAWTSTFQKVNGNWLMTSITSTVAN
ncbi:nuclear transport factor 2 family protein [Marivirga sp. S37H4]|uniref:Nuclear transport factor 2 family protein n=1 Tax=Marivirga aurantiaca TaxID=2802615 RepID=A0A935C832_9BACT|nr:nuclear transport factor 2 family protein [Marivirga aurantiaca]MBK6265239.1 nuclear transport factor 2 family protein [Marivirga aurantiaca]